MSLSVTNRLDKLENEIRVMLMLQKCGGNKFSQGTAVTTTPDGYIKGLEISMKSQPQQPCNNATTQRTNCPAKNPIEHPKKHRRPFSATSESIKKRSSPTGSSIKSDPIGCACKKPKIQINTMSEGPATPFCLCRPPAPKKICKCSINELEREKRKKLEEEIEKLKSQISELTQSKCLAVTMTQQLRRKCDKFRTIHGDTTNKLMELAKEKEYLCKCLEHERARNARKYFSGDISVQVGEKKRGRLDKIQEQEEEIKTLNESFISLTKSAQEKEMENHRLQVDKHQLFDKLKKQKDINKRLADSNGRLAKSVKQKHDSFIALRSKAGKFQKDIKEYKDEARRSQMEIEHLKEELQKQQDLKDRAPKIPVELLEEKLKKTKDRERRASEAIQLLNQKVRNMQNKENAFKLKEQDFQKTLKEHKALQSKYDELVQKLKECEKAEKLRSQNLEKEMLNFSEDLAGKELILKTERDEMKGLINELTEIVKQQKVRIDELQAVTEKQEMVIRSQTESISSHEEQVTLAEKEAEMMRQKYSNLDTQLEKIKASFGNDLSGNDERLIEKIIRMSQDLKETRLILDEQRAKSAIKDKLIEDQYTTIESLKKGLKNKENELKSAREEVRRSSQEIQKSSQELARMARALEREESMKRTVVGDLTNMQRHRDVLEKKVSLLETTVEKMSVFEDTGQELQNLKDNFEVQKQEWDGERKQLQLERERAVEAAKYATKTLIEAMNDFQGQIKSQKKLQKIMTDLISYKDKGKVSSSMTSVYDPKQVLKGTMKRPETQFQQDFTRIHDKQMHCPGVMRYQTCPDEERYFSAYSSESSQQQQGDIYSRHYQYPVRPHSGTSYPQPYIYKCPSRCMHHEHVAAPSCYCGMTPCCCKHKHSR